MMIPFCALGRGAITAILTHPLPLRSTTGHVNADGGSGTTLAGPGTDTSNYYYGGAPGGAHAGYGGRGQQHDDPQAAVAVLSPPSHTPYGNWSRPFDLGSRGSASSFCDGRVSALALVSLVFDLSLFENAFNHFVTPRRSHFRPGGAGGGAVWFAVSGSATIDGSVTARGMTSPSAVSYRACGSGAGGSITIEVAGSLAGTGTIDVGGGDGMDGDDDEYEHGGGGSAGRLAVIASASTFTGTMLAVGGAAGASLDAPLITPDQSGAAGTIFTHFGPTATLTVAGDAGASPAHGAAATFVGGPSGSPSVSLDDLDVVDVSGAATLCVGLDVSILDASVLASLTVAPGSRLCAGLGGTLDLSSLASSLAYDVLVFPDAGGVIFPPSTTLTGSREVYAGGPISVATSLDVTAGGRLDLVQTGHTIGAPANGTFQIPSVAVGNGGVVYVDCRSNADHVAIVADVINVAAGAVINGTGMGDVDGSSPGAGLYSYNNGGSGGGHGGRGGDNWEVDGGQGSDAEKKILFFFCLCVLVGSNETPTGSQLRPPHHSPQTTHKPLDQPLGPPSIRWLAARLVAPPTTTWAAMGARRWP